MHEEHSDQLQIELESFPDEVRPMQAASAEAPFSSAEYVFEVKWDGLRCMLVRDQAGDIHRQVVGDPGERNLLDLRPEPPSSDDRAAGRDSC